MMSSNTSKMEAASLLLQVTCDLLEKTHGEAADGKDCGSGQHVGSP